MTQGFVRRVLRYFTVRPFDTSTPSGRSQERYRRITLTTFASVAAKLAAGLALLITVPVALNHLGSERYGLCMTILSFAALFNLCDFGLRQGLVNAVAEGEGQGDRKFGQQAVSSVFFPLVAITIVLLAGFFVSAPFIPWASVFNVHESVPAREIALAVTVFYILSALSVPAAVVENTQIGHQQGYLAHLWQSAGKLLSLLLLVLAVAFDAGLPGILFALAAPPLFALGLNGLTYFGIKRPWLRPRIRHIDRRVFRGIGRSGFLFLLLTAANALVLGSDNIILAHVRDNSEVAAYAVAKVLFMAAVLTNYLRSSLRPAFGEALARNELAWVRRTLNRALVLAVVLSLPAAPLLFAGQSVIAYWTGNAVTVSWSLIAGFCAWLVVMNFVLVLTPLLNNSQTLARHAALFGAASVLTFVLKIVFGRGWGGAGVIWATALGLAVFYVLPAMVLAYRICSPALAPHPNEAN